MKKIFLGSNPRTSIVGLALGALYALQSSLEGGGQQHWYNTAIAVGIAILGRVAGDSSNTLKPRL